MSNETPNPEELSADMEARIIAWILGESSPFESAEMERLCANDARVAKFRNEMQHLSALVADASHPPRPEERLRSPRREDLLAALGSSAPRSENVVSLPYLGARTLRQKRYKLMAIASVAVAASLAFFLAMGSPSVVRETGKKRADAMHSPQRAAKVQADIAEGFEHMRDAERQNNLKLPTATNGFSFKGSEASGQTAPVESRLPLEMPTAPTEDVGAQAPIKMAPFEVTDSGDSGYRVANTLAGTRVRTSIQGPDIDAALNPQNGRENPDFFRPESLPAQKRAPSSDGGGNLDSLTLSASADKDADEIELSPFVISSVSDRAVNLSASAGTPNGELNYDSNQETGGVAGTFVSARNASTFSLHVGDASYRMASEALNRGELPDPAKIRPEEFYNAFDYGDPAPAAAEAVAFRSEQCADAFLQGTNLLRLSLKVPNLGRSQDQALHLTVLLDTSGSMQRADRSSEVRQAFSALANVLKPYDQVTLIGFARTPRLLADRVKGDQAGKLASIVAHTPADGGTNLELALTEAAQLARRRFDSEALNRVVILTDGAANLGEIHAEALGRLVAGLRQDKISFDACAIGVDGASDPLLETLTRQGEGHYYLVNSAEDVDRQLIKGLAGALRPEATDVKLQVKFNPQRVRSYRLLGFDNYRMAEADFRNNRVAGADLAGGQDANALYDVRVNPSGDGELGRVIVRFRQTATGRMIERSWPLPYLVAVPSFDQAPASLRLAGSVNYLAEWLKNDRGAGDVQLNALLPVVDGLRSYFPGNDDVEQFDHTFNQAIAAGAGRQR